MSLAKRLRLIVAASAGTLLLAALAALFLVDRGHLGQLESLSSRLNRSDKEKLEAVMGEKGLDALKPLAAQLEARREDLIGSVQQLADDGALRALYASANPAGLASAANKKGKPETLAQVLDRLAGPRKGDWLSVELTDRKGKVIASWGGLKDPPKDLSADPLFKQLASPDVAPGLPAYDYLRKDIPKARTESYLVAACGIAGADDNFAGLARVLIPIQPAGDTLFGLKAADALKGLKAVSPKSSVFLMRGNGDQLYHSARGPYAENFDKIGQDYKAVMASMQSAPQGRAWVKSYDGKPGIIAWRRIGSWAGGDASALLSLAAFLPEEDFLAAGAAAGVEAPAAFYKRPGVLVLLLLAFGAAVGLGIALSAKLAQPLKRTVESASQVDEYGGTPEGLEFREEADPDVARINQAFNALVSKLRSSEHRVQELDSALRRVEDQASHDATAAAQELSELRAKVAGAEAEKAAANTKFEAALKARQDAEAQLGNLKGALETSQRSVDLKNSENKNLSSQIQDLMRTLEEQRKVSQQAQESAAKRDDELVRLSAVNTLSSELKATLTVIKNYISTMLGSVGAISDAQQEFLGVVINKSARLERLIADLVELSELGSGIKPPRLEAGSLTPLVQEALLNTRPQADHKKIQLEFAESGNVPQVQLDREKMGGILRALLAQAIKVTSRNEKVSLLLSGRDNSAELRISDPGMSLPPDRAAKVFNQFHGVDSQAGPEFIGTGLRFPIMRAVLEAHGGKISIESQVGRGKTFVIALPKAGTVSLASAPKLPPVSPEAAAAAGVQPAPPPKPNEADISKFDSIFGDAPGSPPKPLGPPPAPGAVPPPPPPPGPGDLPPLGGLPKPSAPPAGLPALPQLPGLPSLGTPPPPPAPIKPLGPPPAPGAVPPPPPPAFKTEAGKGPLKAEDKADFDAIFGAPSGPPKDAPPPMPKVELKTNASLGKDDMDNFAAIFGDPKTGAPKAPPPPGPAAPPPPPPPPPKPKDTGTPDFAAIFGDAPEAGGLKPPAKPSGPPPAPGAVPAPPPKPLPSDMANFAAIFGDAPEAGGLKPPAKPSGPPPAPGAVPAPPPPKPLPSDMANFAAIFGDSPKPAPPPPPPPGGLNTLDDLNNMIQGPG